MEALAALLKLELEEASKRLGRKMALLLLAAFMAIFGYLFLWCFLTMVMAHFWGIIAGLAVTTGIHLVAAAVALILFSRTHVTPIAPATAEELKRIYHVCKWLSRKARTPDAGGFLPAGYRQ